MKRAFKMKSKSFFIVFKRFSLKQIKQFFLDGESPTFKLSFSQINVNFMLYL